MSVASQTETRSFEAEVQQVLDLMIHSLYSNREIFLRELISNASDACDKLRFEALSEESLYEGATDLGIDILIDSEARTLTIRDNGIGMSRDEVIENIGTIARSGTRRFIEALSGDQKQDANLIGQFGVGFYSSFIVADEVTLISRRAGSDAEEGVRWVSDGRGEYSLETVEGLARGTTVTLKMKDDADQFLSEHAVRGLVHKYSDHIAFPIRMEKTVTEEQGEGEEKTTTERREWDVVNQASALWTRPRNEIDEEEYRSFYQHVAHDFGDPLAWAHNRVEGNQSYTTLMYLPEKAPFDLMMVREERHGLKLYVRRVFIMDAAEDLLPSYLRFMRGVVDSDDLPLNVSREILQENRLVASIRASVVKRSLDLIEKLDDEAYATFWGEFGETLKEGLVEDFGNRDRLLKLMRFSSTHSGEKDASVSLDDYLSRMKGGQDRIYYVTAESHQAALSSPHLEIFRKRGIEVLLMSDRVDEWAMGHVQEYEGKPFQSVAKGDLDLSNLEDESEKEERKAVEESASGLVERLQKALHERVESVRVSHRLTDSPACLVLSEHDMAVHMQSLLKQAGQSLPPGVSRPRLEINPSHPLIRRLEGESDETSFSQWATLLYEQAWLSEGGQLEDPAGFVRRLNQMLVTMGED